MASLLDEFVGLTEMLNKRGINYAVCGGWAMAIHGLPRATLDIDVLVLSEDLPEIMDIARAMGYDVEGLPLHFADGAVEIRRISKVDKATKRLFTFDFLLVTKPLQSVWDDRALVVWDEGKTWVVSKKGLITLKSISGRDQDLLDIKNLQESEDEG